MLWSEESGGFDGLHPHGGRQGLQAVLDGKVEQLECLVSKNGDELCFLE